MATPIVADNFNRGDSTGLGTASGGIVWSAVSGASRMNIISNTAGPSAAANCQDVSDLSFGPSMDIEFTVPTVAGGSSFNSIVGCRFLVSNPGASMTGYRFFFDEGEEYWIQRFDAGTPTTILAQGSRSLANGNTIRLEVRQLQSAVSFTIFKNGAPTESGPLFDTSGSRITTAGLFILEAGDDVATWRIDDLRVQSMPDEERKLFRDHPKVKLRWMAT